MSGFDTKSCGWELHVTERVTSEHSCFYCGAKAGRISCVDSMKPSADQGTPHSFKKTISPMGHADVNFNALYLHITICLVRANSTLSTFSE